MKHKHLLAWTLFAAFAFTGSTPLLAQEQAEASDEPLLGPTQAGEGAGPEGGEGPLIGLGNPSAGTAGSGMGSGMMMCPMMGGMMGGGGPGMKGGMMGPGMMGGGAANARPFAMLGALNLSDEQWARINKIRDELRRQNWPLKGKVLDERSVLRDLFAADKRDPEAIGKVYGRLFDLRQQMIVNRVAAGNAIENVLTAEQRQQLKQMRRGGMVPGAGARGMMGGTQGAPSAPPAKLPGGPAQADDHEAHH